MKINWFSPLPPDHTEIANYSARLLPALNRHFEPAIWTSTQKWQPDLEKDCEIQHFTPDKLNWKALNLGGVPIYHIGNNIHFHGDIIRVARACPGVVVLHDLAMHETVMNLCLYKGYGRPEYFDILYRYGGKEAVEWGQRFLDKREIDTNELARRYPLYEYVISNARGIITHNPLNVEAIMQCSAAPVMYAPLPYIRKTELYEPLERCAKSTKRYTIVMFGFLGSSNRRLKPFLEAFAECASKDRFEIVIAGKYPEKDVKQWIRSLSLEGYVKTRGFVTEAVLEDLLRDADLCINLRWPTRGESSATLLRIWNHSLPAIVTDTDYYSTLPRDAVARVNPDTEKEDILFHLESFVSHPEPYFKMGILARQHLEKEHSTEAFAGFLENFLPEIDNSMGIAQTQVTGKTLARQYLSSYPDPASRQDLAAVCSRELALWNSFDRRTDTLSGNVGN